MERNISYAIKEHFKRNLTLYIIVILSLTVGVATGAITVNALSQIQTQELSAYMHDFFYVVNVEKVDTNELFKFSITDSIKNILIIWVLGITVIGIPLVLILIGIKGFAIGFTVGFFIKNFGFNGILLSILSIIPQNIIIIPCYIILGIASIKFSISLISKKRKIIYKKDNFKKRLAAYCLVLLITLFFIIGGSLIETYITPVFIKLISAKLI